MPLNKTSPVEAELEWVVDLDGELPAEFIDTLSVKPTVWFQLWQTIAGETETTLVDGAGLIKMVDGVTKASWADMPVMTAEDQLISYSVKQVDEEGNP